MVKFIRKYKEALIFTFVYWIFNLGFFYINVDFLAIWLCWNTFLGLLPLLFISLAEASMEKNKKLRAGFLSLVWLVFFPNAIYLVTDFIHLSKDIFYISKPYQGIIYQENIYIWLKLINISFGFIIASFLGIKSLEIFLDMIKKITSQSIAFMALVLVSFLSGIAVYIGRFLRFNSWDIVRPFALIKKLLGSLNKFSIEFILLISLYCFSLYVFYRIIGRINRKKV